MLFIMRSKGFYRKDIQGLRALAILSVIFFHTNKEWLPGGFIGVDIFLVISGFLITSIILKQKKENAFSFRQFFFNRVKRIVPAYFFLLSIVAIFSAILLTSTDYKFFKDSLEHSLYFTSNQYFADFGNYFAPNANELPLIHTWSLAVEMQFYLLLPFLVMLLPSKYLKATVVILILTLTLYSSYEVFVDDDKQKIYFSLLARIPEFLIGSWLALNSSGKKWDTATSNLLAAIGLLCIAVSFIYIDESKAFPGIMALPACIGTALIIAAQNSFINTLFSKSILVWIGGLSYSLYLWHWPILAGLRYYSGEYELNGILIVLFVALTFFSAFISYRFIESGFLSKYQSHRSAFGLVGFALFVVFTSWASKFINTGVVTPLSTDLTRYAPPDEICHGKIVGDCIRGNKNNHPSVLLIGDSHAAQLNVFLDEVGYSNNLAFKVITASSCVTIPGFDVERIAKWARQSCQSQIDIVQTLLPKYGKIIIAGMWNYHSSSHKFMNAFDAFVVGAQKRGQDVFVLAQIPMIKSNPVRLQRFNDLNLPAKVSLGNDWRDSNELILKITEKYSNASFIDFSGEPFFERVPFYKKILIYQDSHHLNEVGSKKYGQFVGNHLLDLMDARFTEENTNFQSF